MGKRTFSRSKIVNQLDIVEDSLADALNVILENMSFSLIAISNQDRTQILASLSTKDLLKYMVTNYEGDLSVFKRPENKIDSHLHQTLVRAYKDETLLEVLFAMKQKRISVLPIEERFELQLTQEVESHTIGLLFITDLLYLLRLPNYWQLLSQPVTEFLNELYGQYEDSELSRSIDTRSNSASGIGQVMSGTVGSDVEQMPIASPMIDQAMVVDQERMQQEHPSALEQA